MPETTRVLHQDDPLDRDYAPGWRPAEGEKVRGQLVDLSSRERDEAFGGGPYAILTLELDASARTKEGEMVDDFVAVHVIHEVLERELARIKPKIGDTIGIKYEGKHPDRGYHRYRVHRYGDDGGGFDWQQFGGDDPREVTEDRVAPAENSLAGRGSPAVSAIADTSASEGVGDDDIPF